MDSLKSCLPTHGGFLPLWLLTVSAISIANSIQAYATVTYTRRVYNASSPSPSKAPRDTPARTLKTASNSSPETPPSPVTPLQARTFGTWTLLSSIIRLYAAYNVDNAVVYQLAVWTYTVAFAHFFGEWMVFGTARWDGAIKGPVIVSTGSLIWMFAQWGHYVKN